MAQISSLPEDVTGLVASLVQQGRDAAAKGDMSEAELKLSQAVTLDPANTSALINYGAFLIETKNFEWGRHFTEKALEAPDLAPSDAAVVYNNLAFLDYRVRRIPEAMERFEKSIAADPWYKIPLVSKGAAQVVMGKLDEAYATFDKASLIDPCGFEPTYNKSIVKMTQGDWTYGLPGYELRKLDPAEATAWPNLPRWKGESLEGKCIVAWAEQGFGDNIWAHRLVLELVKRGADKVYLCTYPPLEEILPTPGIELLRAGDTVDRLHLQVPIMSLLYGLRIRPDSPPAPAGIEPSPLARRRWEGVAEKGKLNVGISWSGNINHKFDDLRSIPLRAFADMGKDLDEDISWHALQKDIRPGDGEALGSSKIKFYGEKIQTFADVAAIVEQMDLVITVDTAALHVAAEMGKPTWALIPYAPDFRYGTKGTTLPWYPSLKMYRKNTPLGGDWEATLAKVRRDLRSVIWRRR